MRYIVCCLAVALLILAGCTGPDQKSGNQTVDTPIPIRVGKVVSVNEAARFVVVHFPIGSVPPQGRHLNAYRRDLKVGEVRMNGLRLEDNGVADIVSGDIRAGDEVRAD